MNQKGKWRKISIILFIVIIVYIVCLKFIDVGEIGPNGSKVGFQTMNQLFHNLFPWNEAWYKITKYLGIFPFLWVAYYGLCGVIQIVQRKSLKKIDQKLILLGMFYVLLGSIYLFFEKFVVNYRPILMDGELEASFPSSHTMLAICVCLSALFMISDYIKSESIRNVLDIASWAVMIVLVIGRVLSGVHWITDIVGGILISAFLLSLFYESILYIGLKKKKIA